MYRCVCMSVLGDAMHICVRPVIQPSVRGHAVYCCADVHLFLLSTGEQRLRYFQLLVDGVYTPQTLPVGGEEPREPSPGSLADILQVRPHLPRAVSYKPTECTHSSCQEPSWCMCSVQSRTVPGSHFSQTKFYCCTQRARADIQ